MGVQTVDEPKGDSARNLAYINYALLFAAIFFAGVPAVIAAIIAYSQRDEAPPPIASHYGFQLRIFWVAFAIALAAGVCFLGATVSMVGELVETIRRDRADQFHPDFAAFALDKTLIGLLAATGAFSMLGGLWLIVAPAFGLIRLASGRAIGHSARS